MFLTPTLSDIIMHALDNYLQNRSDDGKPHHVEIRLPDEGDGKVRHLGICLTIPDMQALRDELFKERYIYREPPTDIVFPTAKLIRKAPYWRFSVSESKAQDTVDLKMIEANAVTVIPASGKAKEIKTALYAQIQSDFVSKYGVDLAKKGFSAFDMCVNLAVWNIGSLSDGIYPQFTIANVARAIIPPESNPHPKLLEKIELSVEKQSQTRIVLNCTQEMEARGMCAYASQFKTGTNLLYTAYEERTISGKGTRVYRLLAPPIIGNYCALTGQIARVPRKQLVTRNLDSVTGKATGRLVSQEPKNVIIRNTIYAQVEAIRNGSADIPSTIMLTDYQWHGKDKREGLYTQLQRDIGGDSSNVHWRADIRKAIETVLENMCANGVIKKWERETGVDQSKANSSTNHRPTIIRYRLVVGKGK